MRKFFLYFFMIFLVYHFVLSNHIINAAPKIAPPEAPKLDPYIDNPMADPKIQQETDLIMYILDHIKDYILEQDWINFTEDRSRAIGDILNKYDYTDDEYACVIKKWIVPGRPDLPPIYEIKIQIWYKSNSEVSTVNTFIIDWIPVSEPKKGT